MVNGDSVNNDCHIIFVMMIAHLVGTVMVYVIKTSENTTISKNLFIL